MQLFAKLCNLAQGTLNRSGALFGPVFGQHFIRLLSILILLFLILRFVLNRPVLKRLAIYLRKQPDHQRRQQGKPQVFTQDYLTIFPPSPRDDILFKTSHADTGIHKVLTATTPPASVLQVSQLSSTSKQDLSQDGLYTPTGFSTAEIRALGSFPDYSLLSGVTHPEPCPEFDIKTAEFRPYRPFRWEYHQTMSLSKMEPNFWIELENNYFDMLDQRKDLLKKHKTNVMNYGPGSELACRELMEMLLQYLCIRYPHYFSLENSNTVFKNRLLNTSTDLSSTHPLHVLFEHVPEDFAIMLRDETDGMYYLRAGFICSSIGWNFGTHFNRQLRAIHTEVNDYAEKMAKSMDRYFSKLPTNKPIQRGAWFVEDWKPLFVTPEEYKANNGTRHQGEDVTIDQCYLRVDWQTLRRLPLSGAIVFNFKAIFTPMTDLRDEPYIPALMYKQITDGKPNLTEPKVHMHIRGTVLEALQRWKTEQIENEIMPSDWKEETLAESPFYPGWEERWRQRVGPSM